MPASVPNPQKSIGLAPKTALVSPITFFSLQDTYCLNSRIECTDIDARL